MQEVKEMVAQGWINCHVILEILGKPAEHVSSTMKQLVEKLKENKNYQVTEEQFNDPVEQEDNEGIFTAFVELDVLVRNKTALLDLCFEFMPSSVEINDPEEMPMKALELSDLLNDLMARLHQVDMIAKKHAARNNILERNATNMLKNLIVTSLSQGPKSLAELSKAAGIGEHDLDRFLAQFAAEGQIVKEGDTYKKK